MGRDLLRPSAPIRIAALLLLHMGTRPKARPRPEILASLLAIETDECVLWRHATNSAGYGQIGVNGRSTGVHVIACEYRHGPRPEGLHAAHYCGVKLCVNPRHLRWATRSENEYDKVRHGWGKLAEHLQPKLPPMVGQRLPPNPMVWPWEREAALIMERAR